MSANNGSFYVELSFGAWSGVKPIRLQKELSKFEIGRAFETLDKPSEDADAFTRHLLCTAPATILAVNMSRERLAKHLSEEFAKAFIEAMEANDTRMGYRT
jgi:hypothetical protein